MSVTDTENTFSTRLRKTRELRNLEQGELSSLSGIAATSISHFEAGRRKPSLVNLKNLADALKVSIDYLLGRTENPEAHIDATAFRDVHLHSDQDLELIERFKNLLADRSNK